MASTNKRSKRKDKSNTLAKPKKPSAAKGQAIKNSQPPSSLPVPLQQLILDVFKTSLLHFHLTPGSNEATSLTKQVQSIKAHLYRRDFVKAFAEAEEDALRAYALRWSAGRALAYGAIFWEMRGSLGLAAAGTRRVLCVGGGAGAEIMGLAGCWRAGRSGEREGEEFWKSGMLNIVAVDIADWEGVVRRLADGCRAEQVRAVKDWPAPLVNEVGDRDGEEFAVEFRRDDVLEATERGLKDLLYPKGTSCGVTLVTVMFTLNELFSTSIPKTVSFLLHLTDALEPGAMLLIVDSPGSYSTVALGSKNGASKEQDGESEEGSDSPQRKYPMRFLLEHTLLSVAAGKWDCVLSDDSRWFRRDKDSLVYNVGDGVGLEDMRYQMHLYRRV